MSLQIIAGVIFSLTVILAARDIPPKTRISGLISAAALTAADIFMMTRFSAASAEYEELLLFLNENKQASVNMLPDFMSSFAAGIHDVIIGAAGLLREANRAVLGFADSTGRIAAFSAAAFIASAAVIMLVPFGEGPDSETVGPAKAMGLIILNVFTDSFFAAPAAGIIVYGFCCLLGIEYASVICTVMWILSYIPVIGQAVGTVLGVCILVAACHPVWGIVFGVFSAAVFILLSFGKNVIEGLFEVKEQNRASED